jgi:endonuclease YncB( thermonuclease family)
MLPWVAALAVLGGGVVLYDHSAPVRRTVSSLTSGRLPSFTRPPEVARDNGAGESKARPQPPRAVAAAAPVPQRPVTPTPASRQTDHAVTAAIIPPAPIGRVEPQPSVPEREPARPGEGLAGSYQAKFFLCGTAKQDDCVMAADRFVFHGQKIRLVGIEVPDIKKPRCEAERIKASDAELRVRAFLDSGPFELVSWQGNGDEVDGHKLRDVTRNGRSLADILVSEGLAKRAGAGGWC